VNGLQGLWQLAWRLFVREAVFLEVGEVAGVGSVAVAPAELTALLQILNQPGMAGARWRALVHGLWAETGLLESALQQLAQHPAMRTGPRAVLSERLAGKDRAASALVARQMAYLERTGMRVVPACSDGYPKQLRSIEDPPLALFVLGNPDALARPAVAIVGSRRASAGGLRLAESLAAALTAAGLVVVSGLARGIDAAAHRGALKAGETTLAVLGSGHGRLYPQANRRLADAIAERAGAIVSEYPPTRAASKYQFPERNRIISGLSLGVLVVEASARSGSLITARLALEQGRDVMAVPGPAGAPSHAGCHSLIKEGAALVECQGDVLAALEIDPARTVAAAREPESLDPAQARLLHLIGFTPITADELQAQVGLPAPETLQALSLLELKGFVESSAQGYIRCPI
jgi:DNA processing protein